jgi:hypothetical protein
LILLVRAPSFAAKAGLYGFARFLVDFAILFHSRAHFDPKHLRVHFTKEE